jgi:hypothetical protein
MRANARPRVSMSGGGRTGEIGTVDVSGGDRHAWLQLTRCQFMFLLFRKQNNPA